MTHQLGRVRKKKAVCAPAKMHFPALMPDERPLLLVDNGSLRPEATLSLRCLAAAVAARTGRDTRAVSLLHSSGVEQGRLGGEAAEILEPFLRREAAAGRRCWQVLPLFLGRTGAVTDYIPARLAALRHAFPDLDVRVSPVLSEVAEDAEERLAGILADGVRSVLEPGSRPVVALVDHGSPVPAVTALRDRLASRLAVRLERSVADVRGCSMERRPGPEFAFSDPLLEHVLRSHDWWEQGSGAVIVSMLFLQPGRHAGPDGDVARICAAAAAAEPDLRTVRTPLIGEHPGLVDLLVEAAG